MASGPDQVSSGPTFFGVELESGTGAPGSVGVAASDRTSASAAAGWNLGSFGDPHPPAVANNAGMDGAYNSATPITPDEGGGYHLTHPAGGSGQHYTHPNAAEGV